MEGRVLLCDARGPVTDLLDKMGGQAGHFWLEALKKMLREGIRFPVWKTIELGVGPKTGDEFVRDLLVRGWDVNKITQDVLRHEDFKVLRRKKSVDLVAVTGYGIGCTEHKVYVDEIHDRILAAGLKLCPPDVAPQVCLQCSTEDALLSYLTFAMNPIGRGGSMHYPQMFTVKLDGMLPGIQAHSGILHGMCDSNQLWICIQPRRRKEE